MGAAGNSVNSDISLFSSTKLLSSQELKTELSGDNSVVWFLGEHFRVCAP